MVYPSVTQVLSPWCDFSRVNPTVLAAAADRGNKVHLACSNYASGFMVPPLADGEQGYYDSFRRWFDSTIEETITVEHEYRCEVYKFMGHPDLVCRLKGDSRVCVVDYKTPLTTKPSWKLQLAAYAHLTKAERCFTLRLSPYGKHGIIDENSNWDHDFSIFCNALTVWRFFHER